MRKSGKSSVEMRKDRRAIRFTAGLAASIKPAFMDLSKFHSVRGYCAQVARKSCLSRGFIHASWRQVLLVFNHDFIITSEFRGWRAASRFLWSIPYEDSLIYGCRAGVLFAFGVVWFIFLWVELLESCGIELSRSYCALMSLLLTLCENYCRFYIWSSIYVNSYLGD